MKLESLMGRGYLPKELPAFSSRAFANITASMLNSSCNKWTAPTAFNLARPGTLRRQLSIPNPLSQLELSRFCVSNWPRLRRQMSRSRLSLTRPLVGDSHRSLRFKSSFDDRTLLRTQFLAKGRYKVETDISDFYSSVYTHAIDWAAVGKVYAKKIMRDNTIATVGKRLDSLVRRAQEGQTKGIPIGPDTSLLLAETILCAADVDFVRAFPRAGGRAFRFMDDFEYYATSRAEAEEALAHWQTTLLKYELRLNPLKTHLFDQPPGPQQGWRREIAQFKMRTTSDLTYANDIYSLFSLALDHARFDARSPVLGYAIRRVNPLPNGPKSVAAYLDMLLASVVADPSCIKFVWEGVAHAVRAGVAIDTETVGAVMSELCVYHAPLAHGSEVAWSLTILRELNIPISSEAAVAVSEMSDNASLILFFDIIRKNKSLTSIPGVRDDQILRRASDENALWMSDWLLAYEFAMSGLCSDAKLRKDDNWNRLRKAGVRFFDSAHVSSRVSPQGAPSLGGGLGDYAA